jgi:glycosidase
MPSFFTAGSPIIYYGDEIGMGDNIYLEDRDGVRTPMQWTDGKNAGFSNAGEDSLYLPSSRAINSPIPRSTLRLNWKIPIPYFTTSAIC